MRQLTSQSWIPWAISATAVLLTGVSLSLGRADQREAAADQARREQARLVATLSTMETLVKEQRETLHALETIAIDLRARLADVEATLRYMHGREVIDDAPR